MERENRTHTRGLMEVGAEAELEELKTFLAGIDYFGDLIVHGVIGVCRVIKRNIPEEFLSLERKEEERG